MGGRLYVIVFVGFPLSHLLVRFLFCVEYPINAPIYLLFMPSSLTYSFPGYCVRSEQIGGGGGGLHAWRGCILGFASKFLLARDLMCQPNVQFKVPFRIPVPQMNGESSSADHT